MRAGSFEGLRASDFDAYLPEKWASNVYTRERLEAKQHMLNLARSLEPAFEPLGLKVQRYASDEYPSLWNQKKVDAQWVFFWRTEEDRTVLEAQVDLESTLAATLADPTPMTRHAFLALELDHRALVVGFHLHHDAWVDVANLKSKLVNQELMQSFSALLHELPDEVRIGLSVEEAIPVAECSDSGIIDLVQELTERPDCFLRLGATISREATLELGCNLVDHLLAQFAKLAEVYHFVAWSQDNNYIGSDEEFLERRAAKGARREKHVASEARQREAFVEKKRHESIARKELEELFRREAVSRAAAPPRPRPARRDDRGPSPRQATAMKPPQEVSADQAEVSARPEGSTPAEVSARPEGSAPAERPARADAKQQQPRQSPRRPPRPDRAIPLTPSEPIPILPGHLVKVSKGPFTGQVGIVQDVDTKGTARVMVGLLATRIPLEDLVGLGAAQPSTSKK